MPHRPQTICHSDRNRIIRFLNDSGEHVEERPVMPALSPVEGAASNGQEGSSELQLDREAGLPRASLHYPSVDTFFIRPALISERSELEDLQLRASLNNPGDRDAILAHPDAIELPLQQIAGGRVFVSEQNGAIVGFAAVEPRADGESELDALFVDRECNVTGLDERCSRTAPSSHEHKDLVRCT